MKNKIIRKMKKSNDKLKSEIAILTDEAKMARLECMLSYLLLILIITINVFMVLVFLPILAFIGYRSSKECRRLKPEIKKLIGEIE